jgi:hypothetical protein
MTSTRCVVAMPQFATEFAEVRLSTCLRIPWGEYLPRAVGAAPKAFAEGRGCGTAGRVRCVRARDVVIRDVLPGPSRRVRAAGEIGEFAGARGRAPQFGFALAATGAKGESDALRPRARAGACGAPQIPHPSFPGFTADPSFVIAGLDPAIHLLRENVLAKEMDPRVKPAGDDPTTRQCDYGAAVMTASS